MDIGTFPGTVLAGLLFIMQVFDFPDCIDTKFADDFSAIAVADNVKEVKRKLQDAVNQLAFWAGGKRHDFQLIENQSNALLQSCERK